MSSMHASTPKMDVLSTPKSPAEEKQQMQSANTPSTPAAAADADEQLMGALKHYLLTICPSLLQCKPSIFQAQLDVATTESILRLYLTDQSVYTLCVHKCSDEASSNSRRKSTITVIDSDLNNDDDSTYYLFELEFKPHPSSVHSLCVMKSTVNAALDSSIAMNQQLRVVQISDKQMFENILSLVRHVFLPYSRAILNDGQPAAGSAESSMGLREQLLQAAVSPSKNAMLSSVATSAAQAASISSPKQGGQQSLLAGQHGARADIAVYRSVNRKLGELEVELMRFQENVEIPFITLDIHPRINEFVKRQLASNKSLSVDDMGAAASDNTFLNELQKGLAEWKKAIQRVTKLSTDHPVASSVMQEVSFWLTMDRAILHIYEQRNSPQVAFTFDVLKQNRRLIGLHGFMADSGLSENGYDSDATHHLAGFFRDLPVKRLLAATDIDDITKAIETIFAHFKQLKSSKHPLQAAIQLIHVASKDVVKQCQTIMRNRKLMQISYDEFGTLCKQVTELLLTWNARMIDFQDQMRNLQKQRLNENLTHLTDPQVEVDSFKQRIETLRRLRKEHNELASTVESTFTSDLYQHQQIVQAINSAYAAMKEVDVLDVSADGTEQFELALVQYKALVDKVESELEAKIRQLMEAAKDDSSEMFRVCARFNALFVRPRIQAAIREYQEQLIATVKRDIGELQDKFNARYAKSEARRMSKLRDLPPVSGSIIWSKQIERQLHSYVTRIEQVLGKQWSQHIQGQPLRKEIDEFGQKLQPQRLYQAWLVDKQDQQSALKLKGAILKVSQPSTTATKSAAPSPLTLSVNFDKRLITFFKECKALKKLGMRIPWELLSLADDCAINYPYAQRLEEAIRVFTRTTERIDAEPHLQLLAVPFVQKVQSTLLQGVTLQWNDNQVQSFVNSFGTTVIEFVDNVDELARMLEKSQASLQQLHTIKPSYSAYKAVLSDLQHCIDYFDRRNCSNIAQFVKELDEQVETIFVDRLQRICSLYAQSLSHGQLHATNSGADNATTSDTLSIADFSIKEHYKHEIQLRDQTLQLYPSIEQTRMQLCKRLHQWIAMIVELPRLRGTDTAGAENGVGQHAASASTYRSILRSVSSISLRDAFTAIEQLLDQSQQFTAQWLQYQQLWQLDMEEVQKQLGNNVQLWERLLSDLRKSRAVIDTNEQSVEFGPLQVDYSNVQIKILNQFDEWQRKILTKFGTMVGESLQTTHSQLLEARTSLEKHTLDLTSSSEVIASIKLLQTLKQRSEQWQTELQQCKKIETKILQKNHYAFPADWLSSERCEAQFTQMNQLLQRKLKKMGDENSVIQQQLTTEDRQLEQRISKLSEEWKAERPTGATDGNSTGLVQDAAAVQQSLQQFEARLTALESDITALSDAKRLLGMPSSSDSQRQRALQPIREEVSSLREVWQSLGVIYNEIKLLSDQKFKEVKPIELRKQLTKLQQDMQQLPVHIRQYGQYENLRLTLRDYLAVNPILIDLHGATLRAKHEKQLLKELHLSTHWNELSVGMLWQLDLRKVQSIIRSIVDSAQGESALEEFLTDLGDKWLQTSFQCVDYKQKGYVVRNFEQIFHSLTEWLNDITAMKSSPFYAAFEREAMQWEQKLNVSQEICNVFVDVQRRWLYLEAVFANSTDVQQQLPTQYKQFRLFDKEFVRLMRDIEKEPAVDKWLNTESKLLQELQQHSDTLLSIQKALSSYLDQQRQEFSRFYFIGDDDLLEILGNAQQPLKIQKHLPKMFAGINQLEMNDAQTDIIALVSKEGEVIRLSQPVSLSQYPAVHQWLNQLQVQTRVTLQVLLTQALASLDSAHSDATTYGQWIAKYPNQVVLLATAVNWCSHVEAALGDGSLAELVQPIESQLLILTQFILQPTATAVLRMKFEQLITELVHERDVTREMVQASVTSTTSFKWQQQLRYYHNSKDQALSVKISRATFAYGFEYLGVQEKLVQTPLTNRAYLTLAEALHMGLGGNPSGPAGTGKTETVKALAASLGRLCLVFNCDSGFDEQSMGRLFVGLCEAGCWGCFDEFNRLEERILSAVSQQILTIQTGVRHQQQQIQLQSQAVNLSPDVALFVTMNPGYAGRSQLPDNLKSLFRPMAMIVPNNALIAQVVLYSQGFVAAEHLSQQITTLFGLCIDQLTKQSHYDFGLRALKSVLRSAGELKRKLYQQQNLNHQTALLQSHTEHEEKRMENDSNTAVTTESNNEAQEAELLLRSLSITIVPKLVHSDIALFKSLLQSVFNTSSLTAFSTTELKQQVQAYAQKHHLVATDAFTDKVQQLHEILFLHHGVILVGSNGKSTVLNALRASSEALTKRKVQVYTLDPKAMTKEQLYGKLDTTTLEWADGVFTHMLRTILLNLRNEDQSDHWMVFDGDVDPEWAENLNSVLDDNKLLTLPNGERLALPTNVRIIFETNTLKYATPATVSRCGMVYFSNDIVSYQMMLTNLYGKLRYDPIQHIQLKATVYQRWKDVQAHVADALQPFMAATDAKGDSGTFIVNALRHSSQQSHIMEFQPLQALNGLYSIFVHSTVRLIEYNDAHTDFPLTTEQVARYIKRQLVYACLWAFAGSLSLSDRLKFAAYLCDNSPQQQMAPSSLAAGGVPGQLLLDSFVSIDSQEWELWDDRVSVVDLEPQAILRSDLVIDTVDTARHTDVIGSYAATQKPFLLCGPPGSGKSMTLTAVFKALPEFELVTLNFSSTTQPTLILQSLQQYCKVEKTMSGAVCSPLHPSKVLVLFCDEINLPAADAYNTQHVITFLRSIMEYGGYWRAEDYCFVKLERIQIIGACNPPTDAGRVALTPRMLRFAPLLFVDFPATNSLKQIYNTFNRALFKLLPSLRALASPLTDAMIEVYDQSQRRFTTDLHPHYIYSPRELSRWIRAMYEAIQPLVSGNNSSAVSANDLIRLWAHEALRLFSDRLVDLSERHFTDNLINTAAEKHFASLPNVKLSVALQRPILFSHYLNKHYTSVEQTELRLNIAARLKIFCEEQIDIKLVLFDDVLEHILRIDRVLQQPLGHLLLVGTSGSGKTMLTKFVAWMNGMTTFQIKMHSKYNELDFQRDLREVLTRAGCHRERIAFIFDESNVVSTAFLELMNALLAGGEIPGLFTGNDYNTLMTELKLSAKKHNVLAHTDDELYRYFITSVQRHLHVVFTMNPANEDFNNRSATSPALFNRCVVDWFGEWSSQALVQVGDELLHDTDLSVSSQPQKDGKPLSTDEIRSRLVNTLVFVHTSVQQKMNRIALSSGKSSFVTPRHYLDLIHQFTALHNEKCRALEEQQGHLNAGLKKLKQTEDEVLVLQQELSVKEAALQQKQADANNTLDQMMEDKRLAEEKQQASVEIGVQITQQEAEVTQKQLKVEEDLSSVKPLLEDAENAVRAIKKPDLDQVARFPNPPLPVKLTLQAVVLMLGENTTEWSEVTKVLRRSDFIKSVIQFDSSTVTDKVRNKINKDYLAAPECQYDVVYNASKACGPLIKWVTSVLQYSQIKDSVAPLEAQMNALSAEANKLRLKQSELQKLQVELSERIGQYKVQYSQLISEIEHIKSEMQAVTNKVQRSVQLITNLSSERQRWEEQTRGFADLMSTISGDCLLASAFLTYSGCFAQHHRAALMYSWTDYLNDHRIVYKSDINLVEYLSTATERQQWVQHNLPTDLLCVENAIMLQRYNRYPLLIDPSGQATAFLLSSQKQRKIMRTSFLDEAFLKHLESALRFGNSLLVEDVEHIDPVLNSVLNKEIIKQGGRTMITVGDKQVDFSPAFCIYLSTRDANAHFTPDLCSRVTLINFTVTPASLTSQCIEKVLRSERPDIEEKRSKLMKLQGEYQARLRQLEDELLTALSSVKSNILENDAVLATLERLQQEATEVQQQVASSETVMEEITAVTDLYRDFATACSNIYFTLQSLERLHYLYQFSLPTFLHILDTVLQSNAQDQSTDYPARLQQLSHQLFARVYQQVSRSLRQSDAQAFLLRLVQIALTDGKLLGSANVLDESEVQWLTGHSEVAADAASTVSVPASITLTSQQQQRLATLVKLSAFVPLKGHLQSQSAEWQKWLTSNDATAALPQWQAANTSLPHQLWRNVLLCKALRPDYMHQTTQLLVQAVFTKQVINVNSTVDLEQFIASESVSTRPMLLVSRSGYDPTVIVDELANRSNTAFPAGYQSYALGASDINDQALNAITHAVKKGGCILLKNIHLSTGWLNSFEKRFHRFTTIHRDFRLILAMELTSKASSISQTFLQQCQILQFEQPQSLVTSIQHVFTTMITPERLSKHPVERSRLYFLLAWLHAVVVERLRYTSIGWSKEFEFSEVDLRLALDMIDELVDQKAAGRVNLPLKELPLDAIQTLLLNVMYGGRVDNDFDFQRLQSFISAFFTTAAYDHDFTLASTVDGKSGEHRTLLTAPESNTAQAIQQWIVSQLQVVQSPELLGLPANAELLLLTDAAELLSKQFHLLQDHQSSQYADEMELINTSYQSHSRKNSLSVAVTASERPQWVKDIGQLATTWNKKLMTLQQFSSKSIANSSDAAKLERYNTVPIYRSIQREVQLYSAVVKTVHTDLGLLQQYAAGTTKANNHIRSLLQTFQQSMIPAHWVAMTNGSKAAINTLNVVGWLENMQVRIEHISLLAAVEPSQYAATVFWFGALMNAESLLAAMKQTVASELKASVNSLQLYAEAVSKPVADKQSFTVSSAQLHSADWLYDKQQLTLNTSKLVTDLPYLRLVWKPAATSADNTSIQLPLYLDSSRSYLIGSVHVKTDTGNTCLVIQRGIAVTVWSAGAQPTK